MPIEVLLASANARHVEQVAETLANAGGHPQLDLTVSNPLLLGRVVAVRNPDVLLAAGDPTQGDTLELLNRMAHESRTRPLVLYEACTNNQVIEWVRHGAVGCLAYSAIPMLLAKAVRTVYLGGTWYGRSALLEALRSSVGAAVTPLPAEDARLTHRESEILHLAGQGLSNKEIGRRLEISDQTVKTHLHRVYAKLHQSGRYKAFLAQPRPIAVRAASVGR